MLSVNNVEVKFQDVILVLKGCSLEIDDRAIVCLLGANGGGKTTILKAISGLLVSEEGKVTSGNIVFNGARIDRIPPEKRVEMGIIQVMEGRRVFEHLTTEENIISGGQFISSSELKTNMEMVYSYFPKLKDLRHNTSGYLSGGEQQMLVVARALMANPKLMLLDEPSMGLAPMAVAEIFDIVKRFNQELETSILLVEQNARLALDVASYGYIMENGKVTLDGPSDKLKGNEDVQEFYMGLSKLGKKSYREVKHYKRRKRWLA